VVTLEARVKLGLVEGARVKRFAVFGKAVTKLQVKFRQGVAEET